MNDAQNIKIVSSRKSHKSKAGYIFIEDDTHWQLDKNTKVAVGKVLELLNNDAGAGFVATLIFYASNYSGKYTENINERFFYMLRTTGASIVNESVLINYRSSLSSETEWYLGGIKAFLNKWYELGHSGVSEETIQLLNSWNLKGNIKGDVVKRLDPVQGPLSDIELLGFNEGAIQAYEKNKISISELALCLIISHTGRRPIQISHLKIKDVLNGKNKKGEPHYSVNIPQAKQRNSLFRGSFKLFAVTHELWVILNAQASNVLKEAGRLLKFELQEMDQLELPLFPDYDAITKVFSPLNLRDLLQSDRLHIESYDVTKGIQQSAKISKVHSERTGELLHVTSKRFRYTIGTRAGREGFGVMVIAELLDHSDNQNAHIYIENIPDHVAKLDEAVGHQLAPYAQAFAGVLVDVEKDAIRGGDLNSRIKTNGENTGTCGSYGFCGANAPIPCYTCIHFQPWLYGPHEVAYKELVDEREHLLEITGDIQIAAINDRSILAVAHVIQLCNKRKEELKNG
jgi:integrase